jgi:hypothetical protein
LRKKAFVAATVATFAEVEIDRAALFIHCAVEVHPVPLDLDIGRIHSPRASHRQGIPLPAPLQDRDEPHDPTHNGGVSDREAPLAHQLHQIAVAELVPYIPTDSENDHQPVKMSALE